MVILAVIALLAGVLYGLSGLEWSLASWIVTQRDYLLYTLMLLVGVSVGLHRGILQRMKEYHFKILVIPTGIIVGSVLGGALCGLLTGTPLNQATAISSGLGWYSLSGVMVGELAGPKIGSITFLSNLMREIFSFCCIPWLSRWLGYYSCIAPAGATSEDTTLPMLMRYTNDETVVLAVLNGVICSAMVPILIKFCYAVF